ncbi:hypothetical protein [Marinitoga sp. 1154]|nr:hypothetical protein [Marinitoga sp. 1154]
MKKKLTTLYKLISKNIMGIVISGVLFVILILTVISFYNIM